MESIWEQAKEAVRGSMDPDCFQRWIAPLRFVEQNDGTVVLGCPNAFFKEWVEHHHRGALQEAIQGAMGREVRLHLRVEPTNGESSAGKMGRQLDFAQLHPSPLWGAGLNSNYTFERYVVGPCNEFAYTASLEVARCRQTRYNPLLVLADVGLGKSHLSSAIGNHILEHSHQERVCYMTAEEFINEMVHAIKAKQLEAFKEKFRRQCDVMVIDGVQFLSGKAGTQVELSYTLDALLNANKRIILTSKVLPRDIPEMEESLKSRLGSGLVVDIKPPGPATRRRMLQQKAKQEGVELTEEVTEYLAQRINGNVRDLESVVILLLAKSSILRRSLDLKLASEVFQELFRDHHLPATPSIGEIMECVCRYFRIERDVLLSRSRRKAVYHPRQVAMYLCRQHTEATLTAIGKAFRRDHASVIHSLAVIQRKCQADATTRNQVSFLAEQIRKGGQAKGKSR
jgi:chromosomal replication initiator protein